MAKRTIAAILGTIAWVASVVAIAYAVEGFRDFWNPALPFHVNLIGELFLWLLAFGTLLFGMRSLQFAVSGKNGRRNNWEKPILLGIGCFFPGFLLSLPLTWLWARHTWPGDGQAPLAALEISLYVGVAIAIVSSLVLLKRHRTRHALATPIKP